jgi:hypothetical protein
MRSLHNDSEHLKKLQTKHSCSLILYSEALLALQYKDEYHLYLYFYDSPSHSLDVQGIHINI